MKYNLIFIVGFLLSMNFNAQVAIGKASVDGDGILDFGSDGDKGILLPRVISITGAVPGTLYYDTADSKVKFQGGSLIDLSVKEVAVENQFDTSEEDYINHTEEADVQGTVIGDDETGVPGVLVLDSTEHALILPKVPSYSNVGDPEPGMIVYDESIKMFCVFDGEKWAFWGRE